MSKFGCIDFPNDNIILFKDGLEKTKINKVFLEPISYLDIKGYNIHILKEPSELSNRVWRRIEEELLQRNILYVAANKEGIHYPFEHVEVAKGEDIKVLLAPCILDYIFKYGLARKDSKYVKIGIIGGKINTTLDVLIPIIDKVTDITVFTQEPAVYREIVKEIYQKTRVRMKLMYPNPKVVQDMDIVYDVSNNVSYSNWCHTKAIYVDFFHDTKKQKRQLTDLTPSIWHDFEIICEKHPIRKAVLEAMLYTDGFTRHVLRTKIKNFDISISRVYTLPKS
ncbi:MAG: hypothetical protein RR324_03795 [Cellulosilyticaceae bacterium]